MSATDDLSPSGNWEESSHLIQLVDRFEAAWQAGLKPAIEDFLPLNPSERKCALVPLIHIDLERRIKAREEVRVEGYLQQFSELQDDREAVIDLIAFERD